MITSWRQRLGKSTGKPPVFWGSFKKTHGFFSGSSEAMKSMKDHWWLLGAIHQGSFVIHGSFSVWHPDTNDDTNDDSLVWLLRKFISPHDVVYFCIFYVFFSILRSFCFGISSLGSLSRSIQIHCTEAQLQNPVLSRLCQPKMLPQRLPGIPSGKSS